MVELGLAIKILRVVTRWGGDGKLYALRVTVALFPWPEGVTVTDWTCITLALNGLPDRYAFQWLVGQRAKSLSPPKGKKASERASEGGEDHKGHLL